MTEAQKKLLAAVGGTVEDTKPHDKSKDPAYFTDEQGNKYIQVVSNGSLVLKMVENMDGTCDY